MRFISPSFVQVSNELPVVLHTRCVTGTGGGPDKTIINSPRFLPTLGYRALCAYFHPPGDAEFPVLLERARNADASIVGIPDRGPLDLAVVHRLVKLCKAHNVRIWHGHDYKSNVLGLVVQKFCPVSLVTTVHGWGVQDTARLRLYYAIDRWALRRYQHVIAVSEDLYQKCVLIGVPESHCHYIHNAIDVEKYQRFLTRAAAKAAIKAPHEGLLIGAVGRLSSEKGFDLLIQATALLIARGETISLWIAGEGPERNRLQSLIRRLGVEHQVRLLGFLEDPKVFYQALDIYVLSSLREGLPNSVLEAMAMGAPVLATHVGGVASLIADRHSGLLIEPGSTEELSRGLTDLVGNSALRHRIAQSARDTVVATFSFEVRMRKVASVYDRLTRSRNPEHH